MAKDNDAFRTISEVAEELDLPKHVLRFWEVKFPQIRPMKRGGGRRYYRPEDMDLLRGIRHLLHAEGYTIKGVQKILREQGIEQVKRAWRDRGEGSAAGGDRAVQVPQASPKAARRGSGPERGGRRSPAAPLEAGARARVLEAIRELETLRALLRGTAAPAATVRRGRRAAAGR